MKKRFLLLISLLVVCLAVFLPLRGNAAQLDPNAESSLAVRYEKDGAAFPDLEVNIYRVAQAFPSGKFELIAPFSSYPVNIQDISQQSQWTTVADTLYAYIVANSVAPDARAQTDARGLATFTGLKTGLYLVEEVVGENANGTYVFHRFMVYLPTPQADGSYNYAVEAKPKCANFIPKTHYTVTKLWQDSGNQHSRPKEITVDIYKDGHLYESRILSPENNWSYTWSVSEEARSNWTVAEQSVPSPYTVAIRQSGGTFTLINTCQTQTETPKTGDTFTPLLWIFIMCFSGIALLILGIYGRRHKL